VPCLICFRPFTPTAQYDTPSRRLRNLPCTDVSNREYSSNASPSQRPKYIADDIKQDANVGKSASPSVRSFDLTESKKSVRQRARRSLHYDNNENIIDDARTEYVMSCKRPMSPKSPAAEQPRKRCRYEPETCMLLSMECEPECSTPAKLSTMTIGRKSGQWKVSTPTRTRGMTPVGTPSKNVTFHDSVVGGDSDDVVNGAEVQSPKGTPRRGSITRKSSLSVHCESPVRAPESSGKLTPRSQRSVCLTPKSSQKGTPGRSADAVNSTPDVTPRRSSRTASASNQRNSSLRKGNKATPRTADKKEKDLPARRLLSSSSPGTGRVLRPRTPRSYKFMTTDDADDLYQPDAESSDDEEEFAVKKTPTRKTTNQVHSCRQY